MAPGRPAFAEPVATQPPEAGLLDALSLISDGLLVPQEHPPQVTRDGNQYHVRVPLLLDGWCPDWRYQIASRPEGALVLGGQGFVPVRDS